MSRLQDKVFDVIQKNITDRSLKILELTPGEGYLTEKLIKNGYKNIEVMDIYPENFTLKNVICHRGNLNDPLPFSDKLFDLVISVEGIEHLENQYQFASEINRILKDDGHCVISTPNIMNFASRMRFLLTGFYSLAVRPNSEFEKNWVIEHIYPITFWQLRHIFHTSGLFIKGIYTDKIRRSALMGLAVFPFSFFFTWVSLRKEEDERQRKINMEILKQIHTSELYFGRTQIIFTQKQESFYEKTI